LPDPFVLRRLAGGTEGWLVRLIWLVLFGIATVAWLAVLAWAAELHPVLTGHRR